MKHSTVLRLALLGVVVTLIVVTTTPVLGTPLKSVSAGGEEITVSSSSKDVVLEYSVGNNTSDPPSVLLRVFGDGNCTLKERVGPETKNYSITITDDELEDLLRRFIHAKFIYMDTDDVKARVRKYISEQGTAILVSDSSVSTFQLFLQSYSNGKEITKLKGAPIAFSWRALQGAAWGYPEIHELTAMAELENQIRLIRKHPTKRER